MLTFPFFSLRQNQTMKIKYRGLNREEMTISRNHFNVEETSVACSGITKTCECSGRSKNMNRSTPSVSILLIPLISSLNIKTFEKVLTKKEAQILKILCKFMNQVVAREVVLNGVWGQDDYFVGRSLDVFITEIEKVPETR